MPLQRIVILSVHASPLAPMGGRKTGGMNVYVRKLAQELGRRGLTVDVYTRRTSKRQTGVNHSLGENVRVIHIAAGGLQTLEPDKLFHHLPEFVAGVLAHTTRYSIRYDLIYSHYWLSGWVAQKLKEVWHIPFVQMFHTLGQMKNRIPSAASDTSANQRVMVEAKIASWADRIVAATPAEQAQLLWLYRANRRKIVVVSPGVDLEQFQPLSNDQAKARLNLPGDIHLLVFAGRLEPLKAIDTVIRALAIIRENHPDRFENLRFFVIGGRLNDTKDSELTYLRTLVEELNLGSHVRFLGAREQSELRDYYAAAVAAIMPSDYESFGMAALEAMASGTPVIASEVGGLSFLVRDGETGLHVPAREPQAMAQSIVSLMDNPAKVAEMRINASVAAHQYAWSTIAGKLIEVFESIAPYSTVSHHRR